MRPRRDFVVEIKSTRRQPKLQRTSIWGDTDLKAIKQEVENLAPHIFVEDAPSGSDSIHLPPSSSDSPQVAGMPTSAAGEETITLPILDETSDNRLNSFSEIVEVQLEDEVKEPVTIRPTVPTPGPSRKKPRVATKSAIGSVSREELAYLESENRRLKSIWRSRLDAENRTLNSMLSRVTRF